MSNQKQPSPHFFTTAKFSFSPLSHWERGIKGVRVVFLFVICSLVIGHCSFAQAKEYDGIWFLGFNVQKPPFDNLKVRLAAAHTIDRRFIAVDIASEEAVPTSPLPPGMTGYDPELKGYKHNISYARTLLKKAGRSLNDPLLKSLTLLHTDGIKTVQIAEKIRNDLKSLGMKVKLVEISYKNEESWHRELSSHKHHLFLMGYKAGAEQLFTEEASAQAADSYFLLEPLFKTGSEANFTGYSNSNLDALLDQASVIGLSFLKEREEKFMKINKIIYKDLPILVLFYIEKL